MRRLVLAILFPDCTAMKSIWYTGALPLGDNDMVEAFCCCLFNNAESVLEQMDKRATRYQNWRVRSEKRPAVISNKPLAL
jgi:hypothetical protein